MQPTEADLKAAADPQILGDLVLANRILYALGVVPAEESDELTLHGDYLGGRGPQERDATRTYTDGPALAEATVSYEWRHGIGEVVTVFYTVTNQAARTTSGLAAYNVAPLTVGAYFQKINCFCFTEQTMGPGEKREMPVVFYVDPQLAKDSENDGLNSITLSYTFYPVRDPSPKPVAAGEADKRKGNL